MGTKISDGRGCVFGVGGQMIEFTDITLRQSKGYYKETKKLMEEDGPTDWMLCTSAFVSTQFIAATYMLHFWKNGHVVIHDTDRPMKADTLDEDLRELSQWCRNAGWKHLDVSDRLLEDRHSYEFWLRSFIAGMVVNDTLQQHEDEENVRLSKAYIIEKEEDENAT